MAHIGADHIGLSRDAAMASARDGLARSVTSGDVTDGAVDHVGDSGGEGAQDQPMQCAAPGETGCCAGTIISARQLADAYGVTNTDGSRPDCWGYLAAYGWERDDGGGIEDLR